MKNIHVIVATGEWGNDQLRYRRHRLAEYLAHEPNTNEVIWLCPTPQPTEEQYTKLPNGIKQWKIQDIKPQKVFRFGRYLDRFYQQKLHPLLAYLEHMQGYNRLYLWYTFPGFPKLSEMFLWERVVYDCSDLWASPISGRKSILSQIRRFIIANAETRIIEQADPIFCTSDYLRGQVLKKVNMGADSHVYTYENGVEFSLFTTEAKADHIIPDEFNGTVFGFIGGIKPKLDFQLIRKVAEKRRDWLFLFVGPDGTNQHPDFQQLLEEKNVLWTGGVPPFDVPKYMNIIDIGIMPYKPSPYNEAVFPLKLFEFLAAGKPVLGVHLPSTKQYISEGVYTHLETNDPELFIRAGRQLEQYKNAASFQKARIQLAKTKDWKDIFHHMVENL